MSKQYLKILIAVIIIIVVLVVVIMTSVKKQTELTKESVDEIEAKLDQFVEEKNVEEIGKLLDHPAYEIRGSVVYELGWLAEEIKLEDPKFKQIINLLFKALEDSHGGVRQNVHGLLDDLIAATEDKESLKKLISIVTDKKRDPAIRQSAIMVLDGTVTFMGVGVIWDESTVESIVTTLNSLLKDSNNGVRAQAARSLGNIHAGDAKELEKLLKDPDQEVREAAEYALSSL